jgi:hypothetical protein
VVMQASPQAGVHAWSLHCTLVQNVHHNLPHCTLVLETLSCTLVLQGRCTLGQEVGCILMLLQRCTLTQHQALAQRWVARALAQWPYGTPSSHREAEARHTALAHTWGVTLGLPLCTTLACQSC